MKHGESWEQQCVVNYARNKWPDVPVVCALGGKKMSGRTIGQRMHQWKIAKNEGYEKGTPDLFFAAARRGYHGLFIEMKDAGEKPSSVRVEQHAFIERAQLQGYFCAVCFGREQAENILGWYFLKHGDAK